MNRRATPRRRRVAPLAAGLAALLALAPARAHGGDSLQWYGLALARGTSRADAPHDVDEASAELQLGLDWSRSPAFLAHVTLLARTDDGASTKSGHAGTPEAYLEANFRPGRGRIRLRGGAFYLPTSRENVDALWESPYALSSSALNTWLGEELRPIGLDATLFRGGAFVGGTAFRGNDAFGALPADRGWTMHDRFTLLGQRIQADATRTSSLKEADGRLGWSARGGWNGRRLSLQATHVDNRADGLAYGTQRNWTTRFEIVGAELALGDWTIAAENGWGPSSIVVKGRVITADLQAGYVLVSRRFSRARATLRFDSYAVRGRRESALAVAGLAFPRPWLQLGVEALATSATTRVQAEARARFGRR